MSADALEFAYAAALDLAAASPLSGPANGGTVVAIEGSGFRFSTLLHCRFGWTEVAATLVSETEIRCASPSGESGPATLSVSNNKQDYVDLASSFVYEVSPVVASIAPDVGAVAGGTAVTILGSGFEDVTLCLFGDEAIPATVASATEVRCAAPAAAAGAVAVGVSINGAGARGTSQYRYVAVPEVLSLEPASGGVAGGGRSSCGGSTSRTRACWRAAARRRRRAARWVNSTELECEAPAGAAGDVAVEVSVNGADFTDDGATFSYLATAVVSGVSPASGPSRRGTEVTVTGSDLAFSTTLACRFAFVDVAASFVSSSELRNDETYLVMAAAFVDASTIRCVAPTWAGRETVVLALSSNGVDFTDVGAFAFEAPATLDGIAPTMGSIAGGTAVELRGSNFPRRRRASSATRSPRRRSSRRAPRRCAAPPHAEGVVRVAVSGNGVDAVSDGVLYRYAARAPRARARAASGPRGGGTVVAVVGAHFIDSEDLACSFDGAVVPARWVSATRADAVDFVYLDDLAATAVEPASASVAGGVEVTVTGDGFAYSESLACRFGDAAAARFVSPTELACVAPAHDAGAVVLALSGNGLDFVDVAEFAFWPEAVVLARGRVRGVSGAPSLRSRARTSPWTPATSHASSATCPRRPWTSSPRRRSAARARPRRGTAKLSLSFNGAEARAGVDLTYRYVAGVLLGQLEPASGPAAGGTVVAVSGLNIPDSTDLRCRFGALDVDARWISSTEAECVAPAAAAPGAVAVRLGVADQQMSADALEFVTPAALDLAAASPLSGPANGGTVVAIEGSGFRFSTLLYCRFGWTEVAAAFACRRSSRRSRRTPGRRPARRAAVTILGSGFEDVTLCLFGDEAIPATVASATEYRYVAVPEVLSLEPASGGVAGGGTVIVRGLNFADSSLLACRFDGDAPAAVRGPGARGRSVSFAVVGDGRVLYGASDAFEYKPLMVVSGLSPPRGGTGGGTVVAVEGSGFLACASSVACAFGDAPAASVEVVSATLLRCVAPAHAEGSVAVRVGAAGDAAVGAASDATYGFVAEPAAISVHPGSGARSGGEPITVYGSNFVDASELSCRFGGSALSDARWVSATELVCASPAGAGPLAWRSRSTGGTGARRADVVLNYAVPSIVTASTATLDVFGSGFLDDFADSVIRAVPPGARASNVTVCYETSGCAEFALDLAAADAGVSFTGRRRTSRTSPEARSSRVGVANLDAAAAACVFSGFGGGDVVVDAAVGDAVTCAAPAAPAGFGSLALRVYGETGFDDAAALSAAAVVLDYFHPATLFEASPAVGVLAGGTEVAITGANLDAFDATNIAPLCRFGESTTAYAQVVSKNEIRCVSPGWGEPGPVDLWLSLNDGFHFSLLPGAFTYVDKVHVDSAALREDDTNTTVVVEGAGFLDAPYLSHCVIDDDGAGESCLLTFSYDAAAAGSEGVAFAFFHDVEARSASPAAASAAGGATVTVAGANFPRDAALACAFGDAAVDAVWVSAAAVLCVAPPRARDPARRGGHVRLALSNDGATFFGDVPLAFDAAERRGFADLVVASETTAEGSLVLTVDADPASDLARGTAAAPCASGASGAAPATTAATPARVAAGEDGGAETARAHGGLFVNSKKLCCAWDGVPAAATWISSYAVDCARARGGRARPS
ncbi:hypothetical protein SO694_00002343 [Aureococcus anophagefferens]|uniref:IPT/TIG domain-containing protein n=1 Tax=Aureococcus anophagefferens TaxID=44056 RepID=A0ABR1GCT0_AURAN